jgi:hypothetical protein
MDQAEILIAEELTRAGVTVREHVVESGPEPKDLSRNKVRQSARGYCSLDQLCQL